MVIHGLKRHLYSMFSCGCVSNVGFKDMFQISTSVVLLLVQLLALPQPNHPNVRLEEKPILTLHQPQPVSRAALVRVASQPPVEG